MVASQGGEVEPAVPGQHLGRARQPWTDETESVGGTQPGVVGPIANFGYEGGERESQI